MMQSIKNTNGVNAEILNGIMQTIRHNPELAKVTFKVHTSWNGGDGFKITSTGKDFQMGGRTVEREKSFALTSDYPEIMGGMRDGPTVCEMGMASIGSCISQTIIAYATMMGVKLDSIRVEIEGDVDMRGMTGMSDKVRPGAQEFRLDFHLESKSASKEQLMQLYELGKKFSPAVDTVTHGTVLKMSSDM